MNGNNAGTQVVALMSERPPVFWHSKVEGFNASMTPMVRPSTHEPLAEVTDLDAPWLLYEAVSGVPEDQVRASAQQALLQSVARRREQGGT